jgi:RNA polymerase sigma-70 factor (ECF subfamily)
MASSEVLFTSLYEKHHRAVLAYCLRRTNDSDARDAMAEVFAVAWRRIDDLPESEWALPWLYGVARRVVSRQHRSARRFRRLVEKLGASRPAPEPDVEAEMVMRWEYRTVREALEQLRAAEREVLLLAAWEELTNQEMGEALGCSTEAAAQRLHRAKKKLGRRFRALDATGQPPLTTRGGEGA